MSADVMNECYLRVPDEFLKEFPDLNLKRAQKYYQKYLSAIRRQLFKQWNYGHYRVFSFSTRDADRYCSTFNYKQSRYSIFQTFQRLSPVITIINKGNNVIGKLSTARITDEYIDLLIKNNDATEILNIWFDQLDGNTEIDYIPIDIVSLRHYISSTQKAILTSKVSQHSAKLTRNLRQAQQIECVSEQLLQNNVVNYYCWPHAKNPSAYGRVYYHGLNLQNASRELRRAALGDHYQYDLNAAVYAIKLMMAESIALERDENLYAKYTNTKQYLDLKDSIRRKLSQHIHSYPDPLKLVKQAMTAIGFGARIQNSHWTDSDGDHYGALSEIIRNVEDRTRFMSDSYVIEFKQEQRELTKYIVDYYLKDNEFVTKISVIDNMLDQRGRPRRSQVMAYLFQHMESEIMNIISENLPVVVRIHDAFITRTPIKLVDVRAKLNAISQYLTIESESISGYRSWNHVDEAVAHENFIRQEELRVANLLNKPVHQCQTKPITYESETRNDHYSGAGYVSNNYDPDFDPFYDE